MAVAVAAGEEPAQVEMLLVVTGGATPNATIVLTGGTSLGVQYYTYKGQNYYSAQDLLDVLGNENITGTVDIPLVAADGSSRVAKYVVTDRGRTLKHPYEITLTAADGTYLYPSDSTSGTPEYFYASDGFPMSKITTTETPVTINGEPIDFPITAWNINGATVAADGTLIGFGEGTTLEAAPVTPKYFVDNGTLYIDPSVNGETIKITAADGPITNIEIDNSSRVALDLSDAVLGTSDPTTWDSDIIDNDNHAGLTGIILPRGITTIDEYSFDDLPNLESVTLPQSLVSIGTEGFSNCPKLTTINIPNGVTSIGEQAFQNCIALTSINIPNSVTTIGDYAFQNTAITSVAIPANIQNLGEYVFTDCAALQSVTIPNGVTAIKDGAFSDCNSLTSINIPSSVTTIGENAFKNTGLTSIVIPPSVTTLASTAFDGCTSLTKATVPIGVSSNAFSSTDGIRKVIEEVKITREEGDLTTLPSLLFGVDHADIANAATHLVKVVIPEGIERIEDKAFMNCTALAEVNIPDSVIVIRDCAFDHCANLTTINLNNVQYLGVFSINYTGITELDIPASVSYIGNLAFDGEDGYRITLRFHKDPNSITYENTNRIVTPDSRAVWTDDYGITHTYSFNYGNTSPWQEVF